MKIQYKDCLKRQELLGRINDAENQLFQLKKLISTKGIPMFNSHSMLISNDLRVVWRLLLGIEESIRDSVKKEEENQ